MNELMPATGLELVSLVTANAELELSLRSVDLAAPADDEVVIRVEAAPINPSDLGLLLGPADTNTASTVRTGEREVTRLAIAEVAMKALQSRVGEPMLVGNEGAGVVIATGQSPQAQALLGKTVATFGGAMYVQYRTAKAAKCVPLPEHVSAADGAAMFVNPLTVLSMIDVMRREGHTALVHTAAASNLGQMLNRVCLEDRIPLVNIVRSEAQVELLREQGATHVCNSTVPDFNRALIEALVATGATLAFDAIGGGTLASQILSGMESAITRSASNYNRYGSSTHKQVYIYGMLDTGPTILKRNFGPAFGVAGWLLPNYLPRVDADGTAKMYARVLTGLKTTFASHYTQVISLAEALQPKTIAAYSQRSTGGKFLIDPTLE